MSSNRHLGRIIALQSLYEYDLRTTCQDKDVQIEPITERGLSRYQETIGDKQFIKDLIKGVLDKQAELDDIIRPVAVERPIEQIATLDKVIIRMGVYELKHTPNVPHKVVINEAVELAKAFGGERSSKFINGVLGTVLQQLLKTKPKPKPKPNLNPNLNQTKA